MNTLPTLSIPTYRLTIPSIQKEVNYRPYLVREEKVLMIALESEDSNAMLEAMVNTVKECITWDGDVWKLPKYDIEYIFLKLRSKSVGETIETQRACISEECEHITNYKLSIDDAKVKNLNNKTNNIIKLSDDLSLELAFPLVGDEINYNVNEDTKEADMLITSAANSLVTIYYGDDIYDSRAVPLPERIEFIGGLNTKQFTEIITFLLDIPYLSYEGKFKCDKCGTDNTFEYVGLLDFFI